MDTGSLLSSSAFKCLWTNCQQIIISWTLVSQTVETRHADQCAKRWCHFLDPSLTHEQWDKDEDERLLAAVATQGRCWKVISETEFPQRSPTDIKNRYIIIQRKLKQEENKQSKRPAPTSHPSSHPSSNHSRPGSINEQLFGSATPDSMNAIPDASDLLFLDSLTQQRTQDTSFSADSAFSGFFPVQFNTPPASTVSTPSSLPQKPGDINYGATPNNYFPNGGTDLPSAFPALGVNIQQDTTGKFTLELEDLEPDTLGSIMSVVLKSREQLNMKFVRSHDV